MYEFVDLAEYNRVKNVISINGYPLSVDDVKRFMQEYQITERRGEFIAARMLNKSVFRTASGPEDKDWKTAFKEHQAEERSYMNRLLIRVTDPSVVSVAEAAEAKVLAAEPMIAKEPAVVKPGTKPILGEPTPVEEVFPPTKTVYPLTPVIAVRKAVLESGCFAVGDVQPEGENVVVYVKKGTAFADVYSQLSSVLEIEQI